MEESKKTIKCIICNKNLTHYHVVLPCGESICKSHTTSEQQHQHKETKIFCSLCKINHTIEVAEDRFTLLKEMHEDKKFGAEYNKLVKSSKKLIELIEKINLLKKDPYNCIYDYISELKNRVDIMREECKLRIDEKANRIINELEIYENECKMNLNSNEIDNATRSLNEKIEEIRNDLNDWNRELNKFQENEENWRLMNTTIQNSINNLNAEIVKMKNVLLLNKLDHFEIKIGEFNHIEQEKDLKVRLTKLKSKIVSNSNLENDLLDLCNFSRIHNWKLLYRASEDGYVAKDFHSKCDNIPNTLTIIKSGNGCVFGGFTQAEWDKSNSYKEDKNAFIFSLINKVNNPVKIQVSKGCENYAIYCSPHNGPCFGHFYHDISISNYSNLYKNISNLGSSYKYNLYAKGSNEAKCFLAGSHDFECSDIEVYQQI